MKSIEIIHNRTGKHVMTDENRAASLVRRGKYSYLPKPKPKAPKSKKKETKKDGGENEHKNYHRRDLTAEE